MAISTALIGLTVASAAASAVGSVMQSNAQAQQLRQQQATENYNAQVQMRNAYQERLSHQDQDNYAIQQNNAKLAEMRSAFGSSGLMFSGSSMDVLQSNATAMAQSTANSDYTEELRQQGMSSQVLGMKQQANAYGQQAKNATTSGIIGAGTSILGSFGSFAGTKEGANILGMG